jgi:hypothetical protein
MFQVWLKSDIHNIEFTWEPTGISAGSPNANPYVFVGAKNVSKKKCKDK